MREHNRMLHDSVYKGKSMSMSNLEAQCQHIIDSLVDIRVGQIDLLEDIKYIRAYIEGLDKNKGHAGRKKCKLFYSSKPIDDSELEYLLNTLEMSVTDIAKKSKYVDSDGNVIDDKDTIVKYLNNRTRKYRRKGGKTDD